MANDVFANGREISCKKADGKSICAFPDVCFTPPENPATPPGVPVPYPNTGMAKDTTSGSKKVKISDQEVMLKNKSYFKKSIGDEAGSAAKKGVVTSVNRGKVYFISWSMDVKFEGENVVRHLDMTTHNHGSPTSNTAAWIYADRMEIAKNLDECQKERANVAPPPKGKCKVDSKGNVKCPCGANAGAIKKAKGMPKGSKKNAALRKAFISYAECMKGDECQKAAKCILSEKSPDTCCAPQTPHHVVPGSQFVKEGTNKPLNQGVKGYKYNEAPCICVEGENQTQGTHGGIHFETATRTKEMFPPPDAPFSGRERWSCGEAEEVGAEAVNKEFPQCSKECIQAQLRKKHQDMGVSETASIRPTAPGPTEHPMNNSTSFG